MNKKTITVVGSQGFIGSYICNEFLEHGYNVIGIDNYSKYGSVARQHDDNQNFKLIKEDICDIEQSGNFSLLNETDYIIAAAAMIGGIGYFHKYSYDLLSTNERILCSTFDIAIKLFKEHFLKRILVLSSSMVFENTKSFPTDEREIKNCPPRNLILK